MAGIKKLSSSANFLVGLPIVSFASHRDAIEQSIKDLEPGESVYFVIDNAPDALKNETVQIMPLPSTVTRSIQILSASFQTGRDISALTMDEQTALAENYVEDDHSAMASVVGDCPILEAAQLSEIQNAVDYVIQVSFNGANNKNSLYKTVTASLNAVKMANVKANAKNASVPLLKLTMASNSKPDDTNWLRVDCSTKESTLNSTRAVNVFKMIALPSAVKTVTEESAS